MPDIFLSYNREDVAVARAYRDAFAREGLDVWWDATLRSGETYDEVTEEALRAATAVVVLWSKKSVTSRWVRAEATLADRNRTLVPARIEACDLPIMFELTQTADLCRWDGGASDPAWRAFLADVRRCVEAGRVAPELPAPRPSAPAARRLGDGARPSLAVLPFVNRSELRADDAFAEGMVEDLTAALSASDWMETLAASATATYRTGARDLRQIGHELGVRYLLEGNVRRAADNLRVTAQLVEAENGKILWTQKFDRPVAELSALQDDLVTEVAAHLGVQVKRAEMAHALKKPGEVSAWEASMRSHAYSSRSTRSGWEASVAEAKRRVELDPNEGDAYASLASAQAELLHLRGDDDPELTREILDNIRRARTLDPDNPAVLHVTAWVWVRLGKPQDALPLAEFAFALNPNLEVGRLVLGGILARLGRSDEALDQLDASQRLAPNSLWECQALLHRSIAHALAGRFDQALEASDRAARLRPGGEALVQSVLCLAKLDRWDGACDTLRRLRDTDPEMSRALVEKLARDFYCGSNAVEDYVAIARKVWDEALTG
jgi:TolB-like protein